nr:MAG TPA: Hemolysin [Caudoviricetes sp.]
MSTEIIIALIGLGGSAIGSILGIIASSKLTLYRIKQLEEKVDKHNSVIERVYHLETQDAVINEEIGNLNQRINNLENKQ